MNIPFWCFRFFCGRKKKFGLNLQGVCDHLWWFISVDIGFLASSSVLLCFVNSFICEKLQEDGIVLNWLCLYSDAPSAKNLTMVVPFKGAAYNFYHSQLQINIECAFGMLVHHWGILRKPIQVNISIDRTTYLVRALWILYNFVLMKENQLWIWWHYSFT